jgi:hypothetical protein
MVVIRQELYHGIKYFSAMHRKYGILVSPDSNAISFYFRLSFFEHIALQPNGFRHSLHPEEAGP